MSKVKMTQKEALVTVIKDGIADAKGMPWCKPWQTGELKPPHNPVTKSVYSGGNVLLALIKMYKNNTTDSRFLTFSQIRANGYKLNKGSKALALTYFTMRKDPKDEDKFYPMAKGFNVFNASDVTGIEEQESINEDIVFTINPKVTDLIDCMTDDGVEIVHAKNSQKAFYVPADDKIVVPTQEDFKDEHYYYSTLIHEMAHATIKRVPNSKTRMKLSYALEELVAQITSYQLSCELGLPHDPTHSFCYLDSWYKDLNDDDILDSVVEYALEATKYLTNLIKN